MSVKRVSELDPRTALVVTAYLDSVGAALADDPEYAAAVKEDVESHLLGALDADSSPDDASAIIAELGEPSEYAEDSHADTEPTTSRATGTILGMPYDVRVPTAERVASRWWNPRDPRIFMPRVFGIGWDLNFGAIAVKLHLLEPDAEDEAFAEVPKSAFVAAAAVPVLLTLSMPILFAAFASRLPAQLPVHWGVSGQPDRYSDTPGAFWMLFLLAAVPTAWALWSFAGRRSPLRLAAVIALASLMSTLAAATWLLTIATALGIEVAGWAIPVGVLVSLAVPMVLLTTLSRIGRARELRRDLQVGPRPKS